MNGDDCNYNIPKRCFKLLLLHLDISTYFQSSLQSLFFLVFFSPTNLKSNAFITGFMNIFYIILYHLKSPVNPKELEDLVRLSSMYLCFWDKGALRYINHCTLSSSIWNSICKTDKNYKVLLKIAGNYFLKLIKEILHQNADTDPDF